MNWWQAIKIVSRQPANLTKGQELAVMAVMIFWLGFCAILK